jgi:FtsP/CotA-like multicopper oxidase with cupredoxin domain
MAGGAAGQTSAPAGGDNVRIPEAVDRNPDPRIVEIDLEARIATVEVAPGVRTAAWTYNGGVPGPVIHVRAGDRLIVHFTNRLPDPTTVHWHGVRVPIQMDGVPGYSQPDVEPGGSFVYDFVVPDAGLFWYHPHVMSAAQVGFGLYGAILVDDPADAVGIPDELVLVLSDIELKDDLTLESPTTGGSAGMAFGREGNRILVNGRQQRRMTARSGALQRWRIVNTAKTRYFQLDLAGQMFTKIGGDGGFQQYSEQTDWVVLAPGERADVIVAPQGAPGSEIVLRSYLYNRGFGSIEARPFSEDLITIAFTAEPPLGPLPRPQVRRAIEPLSLAGASAVNLEFGLEQLADGSFRYLINGAPFLDNRAVKAQPGDTQIWTITNKTPWSHPFHLHGFFFQVLDKDGVPARPLAWKDTVNIPFDQTLRFVVKYDDREGGWMFHCHILDHAEGGLMGVLELGTVTAPMHLQH